MHGGRVRGSWTRKRRARCRGRTQGLRSMNHRLRAAGPGRGGGAAARGPHYVSRRRPAARAAPQVAQHVEAATTAQRATIRAPRAARRSAAKRAARRNPRAAIRAPQSARRNPRAAICVPQSVCRKPRAEIRAPPGASREPRSARRKVSRRESRTSMWCHSGETRPLTDKTD